MTELQKNDYSHFKRYKSGNIKWYFGTNEYHYYQALIVNYIQIGFDAYYLKPLEYTTLNSLWFRVFKDIIAPESVKITTAEAVAVLWLLKKEKESQFLITELQSLLHL